jgi:hypothetical protein
MAFSHIRFSQSRKNNVSQLVQGFPEQQRVDRCPAPAVIQVQPVDLLALDQKGHNRPAFRGIDPDAGQPGAVAQEKSAPEDVRGLNRGYHAVSPPFIVDFYGEI